MEERVVDARQLCFQVPLSLPYIRQLTRERKIPHIKVGRRVLFRLSAIEEWLKEHEVEGR